MIEWWINAGLYSLPIWAAIFWFSYFPGEENRLGRFARDLYKFVIFAVIAILAGPVSMIVAGVIVLIGVLRWSW